MITFSYVFLMIAYYNALGTWSFPRFGSGAWAFIISLGTLVGAQITNRVTGPKGAGEEHPAISDLVVHGGVLALDRVQQLVWLAIAAGGFLLIVVGNYSSPGELPEIPNELLVLMGLSAGGYLVGKAARGAGPNINEVTVNPSGEKLMIRGQQLSLSPRVFVNDVEMKVPGSVKAIPDPTNPAFAHLLEVDLSGNNAAVIDPGADRLSVTVINDGSGQEAKWAEGAKIVSVEGDSSAKVLTIKTKFVSDKAVWTIPGTANKPTPTPPVPGTKPDTRTWTVTVPAANWPPPGGKLDLTVLNPGAAEGASYTYSRPQ